MVKRTLPRILAILAIGLLVGGIATLVSAHGGDTTLIHSCVQKSNGGVRIVGANDICKVNETSLDWNIVGPAGSPGPTGPEGPMGPAGPARSSSIARTRPTIRRSPSCARIWPSTTPLLVSSIRSSRRSRCSAGCVIVPAGPV